MSDAFHVTDRVGNVRVLMCFVAQRSRHHVEKMFFLWRMSFVGLLSNSALRRYTNAFFYAFLILYITALSAYLKKHLTP